MQHIPFGACLIVAPATGMMDAKSCYNVVPQRAMNANQFRFDRANKIAFGAAQNHETAPEILYCQVFGQPDAGRVFAQSAVQIIPFSFR